MSKYFSLNIEKELDLVIPEFGMADEVFKLLDSDREHLRTYLSFIDDSVEVSSQTNYFKMKLTGVANGTDKLFFITLSDKIIGCLDLHFIDETNHKAEIGYWLHSSYIGKGIMTKAVRRVSDYSFNVLGLNKLTIFADVENQGSNKVAIKSGFEFVGIKKEDIFRNDDYRDMNEYCLLKSKVK